MPLLGRFIDDFLSSGTNNEDLRVAKLCNVQQWARRITTIDSKKSSASRCCSIPWVRFGSCLLGLFKRSLQIRNRIWFILRTVFGVLCLQGPEMKNKSGPEPVVLLVIENNEFRGQVHHTQHDPSLLYPKHRRRHLHQ